MPAATTFDGKVAPVDAANQQYGHDMTTSDSVAQDQLRAFLERIERMEEEKKAITDDIKEIYAEAKGSGFDTKVLRQIVRLRKLDHNERMEQEALLDMYLSALGMAAASADGGA
jgi:uncharacterized protein (UPF0335 family)